MLKFFKKSQPAAPAHEDESAQKSSQYYNHEVLDRILSNNNVLPANDRIRRRTCWIEGSHNTTLTSK